MQARAALRFVTFAEPLGSEVEADRFFDCAFESVEVALSSGFGEGGSIVVISIVSISSSASPSGERPGRISSVAIFRNCFQQDASL